MTAYARRFCYNLLLKSKGLSEETRTGPLLAKELDEAQEYWIKVSQSGLT